MNFDAIIIGAGPAGCSAGIELAKKGWKIAILEKSEFPRHKVCGEFFSPGIVPYWKKLGIYQKIKEAGALTVNRTALYFPDQKEISIEFTGTDYPAYTLSRFCFDKLMLDHARESGCHIFSQTEALKISECSEYCITTTKSSELRSTFIVMAAGKRHRFQKKSSRPQNGKIGFKRHYKSPCPPQNLELYFFPGGYLGLLPIENSEINLCGILKPLTFKKHRNNFDLLLTEILKKHPNLKKRLETSSPSTPWLSCTTPKGSGELTTKRVLWAGDGAYFLEPMIGQGMTMAMACGILAAESLMTKKNPGKYFSKMTEKRLKTKRSFLSYLEPLGEMAAKVPKISSYLAALILKPHVMEKILSNPDLLD